MRAAAIGDFICGQDLAAVKLLHAMTPFTRALAALGICLAGVYVGRQTIHAPPPNYYAPVASVGKPEISSPAPLAIANQAVSADPSGTLILPNRAAQMAALDHEYRTDPAFRQLVAIYNLNTGHPGRSTADTLAELDQEAVANAPVFALMQYLQPQPIIVQLLSQMQADQDGRNHDGAEDLSGQPGSP